MIAAAIYLNVIFCTTDTHTDCRPAQFMWTESEFLPTYVREAKCQSNAELMNQAQADKSVFYRCDSVKGENQ
jgi:hypothetical protein